jgi:hypothetical protein
MLNKKPSLLIKDGFPKLFVNGVVVFPL